MIIGDFGCSPFTENFSFENFLYDFGIFVVFGGNFMGSIMSFGNFFKCFMKDNMKQWDIYKNLTIWPSLYDFLFFFFGGSFTGVIFGSWKCFKLFF